MAGGPFTKNDQWGHPGLADRTECSKTLRCIKVYKDLVIAILGPSTSVGIDGDGSVTKNRKTYIKDQNGFYHELTAVVVDGRAQVALDDTGYAFNSIP